MICIPILARTTSEALDQMERCLPLADCVELRIDYLMDADLGMLMRSWKGRVLVTNRRKEEGGGFAGSERERIERLKQAVELGAHYVDVELSTEESLLQEVVAKVKGRSGLTRLIVSHHELRRTPSVRELRTRVQRCWGLEADIAKIVTKANSIDDNLKTLGLLPYARRRNKPVIAFCMGEMGRPGRVLAPLLGSYMSFVSLTEGQESAPGQLTVEEMRRALGILTRGMGPGCPWAGAPGAHWERSWTGRPERGGVNDRGQGR